MITASNFCHVETVGDIKVLFFAEYDGDNVILHQITSPDIGTVDIKVTFPEEKFEEMWPGEVDFKVAAAKVIKLTQDLGTTFGDAA